MDQIDLETGKVIDFIKFVIGNLCLVTGGANQGGNGVITNTERHLGSFDVVFAPSYATFLLLAKATNHAVLIP